MKKIHVGLIGVTGYTGMELVRLLAGHPHMQLTLASSRAEAGKRLGQHYPFLEKLPGADIHITEPNMDEATKCDVVFLAVPHSTAMNMGAELLQKNVKVVDLSADFRLRDAAMYEAWYNVPHTQQDALRHAVYGLPELYASEIAEAQLIANPGCYPSAAILGLYAALKHQCIRTDDIVIDAKSGTTGAGRKASVGTLFCEVSDTFKAYNLGKHRHTPEIEQELSAIAQSPLILSFNTHLLPINRGILATMYTKLIKDMSLEAVHDIYTTTWQDSPWIRVLPMGHLPEVRHVRGTMFCDIGLVVDARTQRLLVVSAIDNVCRGASGQAIANANLMMGLPMDTGLVLAPLMP